MRHINAENIEELALSQVHNSMKQEFLFDSQEIGSHTLYRGQSCFSEDVLLEGREDIPLVRFCYMRQSKYGLCMETPHLGNMHIRKGEYILFFSKEGYHIQEAFKQDDLCEGITINVNAAHFQSIAEQYSEVFMPHFERYEAGKGFFLTEKPCYTKHFEVVQILRQLQDHQLLGNSANVYADLKVLELFLLLFTEAEGRAVGKYRKHAADCDRLEEVQHIITSDLWHTPSIEVLAHKVGLNPTKLCVSFKEAYGTMVYGYLFEHKMQLARRLLTETDMNVSEVAWECGYTYVSHFSKAFKKRWGVVPSLMSKE